MKTPRAPALLIESLEKPLSEARSIDPAQGARLLVPAGDIHNESKAAAAVTGWSVPVLDLAGNHQFHGAPVQQARAELRNACKGTNIRFLDNKVVEFNRVRFLGCTTLWADFCLRDLRQSKCMQPVDDDGHMMNSGSTRDPTELGLENQPFDKGLMLEMNV